MQRTLIAIGLLLVCLGVLWPWVSRLGRLPGDLWFERETFRLYIPITGSVVVSLVVSIVLWWWRR